MADKKKLSVAEILAAARKSDSQGGAEQATEAPSEGSPANSDAAPAAEAAPVANDSPPKPAKSASGGRMSVAEMMAAARAEKAAGAKPAAKPAAAKAAPAKPAPAAVKAEAPAKRAERDTTSILVAARKATKPGPMSKAEAAAKAKADPDAAPTKPKVVVPPMPEKPAYAKPPVVKEPEPVEETRRDFMSIGFWMVGLVSLLWTFATVKFMFPNVRREPPSKFKVGPPDAFPPGQVSEKFKAQFGVWVANAEVFGQQQIYALKSVCTHLGCTPNWLEAEQKFKCPCHGSGFYKDGINFEGPAPRPLERYAIRIAEDGQIEIDKSKTFQEEMGGWADPSSFIPV